MSVPTEENKSDGLLESACDGDSWVYSEIVREHFFDPKNFMVDETSYQADGFGATGSPACGDMMNIWIKVDKETGRIKECKWRTFGCASAIASTSMLSVMATENGGMDVQKALKINPEQIIERLGGLPDRKFHCSVLGHLALSEAVKDYLNKQNNAGKKQ